MNPFHERLARIGLAAASQYGLALGGGYAIQAAGFLERPSEDIDLFALAEFAGRLDEPAQIIIAAYEAEGLTIQRSTEGPIFLRLLVTDPATGDFSKVELIAEARANSPVQMWIGPVLHPADAVFNKMGAFFDRADPRDFVDINAVLVSGEYSRSDLFEMAVRSQAYFELSTLLGALGRLPTLPDARFTIYGMSGPEIGDMRMRFAGWRDELLA